MGRPPKHSAEEWQAVDWLKPLDVICSEMGEKDDVVRYWAKACGADIVPPANRLKPGPKSKTDWAVIDWRRESADIAEETGYTIRWVEIMRGRHSARPKRARKK